VRAIIYRPNHPSVSWSILACVPPFPAMNPAAFLLVSAEDSSATLEPPVVTPPPGLYTTLQNITMISPTSGAAVY